MYDILTEAKNNPHRKYPIILKPNRIVKCPCKGGFCSSVIAFNAIQYVAYIPSNEYFQIDLVLNDKDIYTMMERNEGLLRGLLKDFEYGEEINLLYLK